ncbi:MAG: thiamine-phosphate kinase [Methanocalculaceae archaeon]|jgi:thiamine-monophosphate kinase|nr:thiamine-phosphate kinase [Methanocalculaceae archaeon]
MDDRQLLETIRDLIGRRETSDDCAAFPLDNGRKILVSTTDMLHKKTDFPLKMTSWQMGWMSVAASLSDIASCGAQPTQVLVAVGLDRPERLRAIMEGAVTCTKSCGAVVAGGDIDSHAELTIVTTAFGIVEKEYYCTRSGAKVGDLVCITGRPGSAQAALDGCSGYWENLVMPKPQVFIGQRIARAGASAMMDVSDGLAISLHDMGEASGVGFMLRENLPLLPIADAKKYFLYGGGDYGLLFTIPREKFVRMDVPVSVIGEVVEEPGVFIGEEPVEKLGYAHVWN